MLPIIHGSVMCTFNTNSYIFINSTCNQNITQTFNSLKIANPVSQVGNTQHKLHFSLITNIEKQIMKTQFKSFSCQDYQSYGDSQSQNSQSLLCSLKSANLVSPIGHPQQNKHFYRKINAYKKRKFKNKVSKYLMTAQWQFDIYICIVPFLFITTPLIVQARFCRNQLWVFSISVGAWAMTIHSLMRVHVVKMLSM